MASKYSNKDAYYFTHDTNARNDPKVLALRSVYGAEGYGIYFMLLEILREQPNYKYPVTKYMWQSLSMQIGTDPERLQQIVIDCCTEFSDGDHALLTMDDDYLYSESFLKRMGVIESRRNAARNAANSRWKQESESEEYIDEAETEEENVEDTAAELPPLETEVTEVTEVTETTEVTEEKSESEPSFAENSGAVCANNADAMRMQCGCNAENENRNAKKGKERKEKEKKEKETKGNETKGNETKGKVNETNTKVFEDFAGGDMELLAALKDFEKMRKMIKRPMTPVAKQRLVTRLGKLATSAADQIELLRYAEEKCWLTVFRHDDDDNRPARQQSGNAGRLPASAKLGSGDKMSTINRIYESV